MLNFLKRFTAERRLSEDWDEFYHAFEGHVRGSVAAVLERHSNRYTGRLKTLASSLNRNTPLTALDLGCGRGEFVEFAARLGFDCAGIDLNGPALKVARSRALRVEKGNFLTYLMHQPGNTLDLVSSIHVLEHGGPEFNFRVIQEVHRVLRRGGAFLVETQSVLSLYAMARNFFIDPSRKDPVHPEYLEFLVKHLGFRHCEFQSFSPVLDANRASFEGRGEGALGFELSKVENWLYGPQEICGWFIK